MYFGEYLVSKGIITQDGLVDALIDQVKGIPSISEILFQKKALPSDVFLKAFALQSEKRIDFRQACKELNCWNEDLETSVSQEIQSVKIPLGQILIKKGFADLGTITKALDEFLSRIDAPKKQEAKVEVSNRNQQQADVRSVEAETGAIDPIMLEDVLLNLSDDKIDQIRNQFSSLEILGDDISIQKDVVRSLLNDLHLTRGLMRCIRADKFEALLSILEKLCIRVIEHLEAGKKCDLGPISILGISSLDMVQKLREVLKSGRGEMAWFSDDLRRTQFKDLIAKIGAACTGGL